MKALMILNDLRRARRSRHEIYKSTSPYDEADVQRRRTADRSFMFHAHQLCAEVDKLFGAEQLVEDADIKPKGFSGA